MAVVLQTERSSSASSESPSISNEEAYALFEARIQRGEKIDADDWMPPEYRKAAAKMVGFHAAAECGLASPFLTGWVSRAPSLKRKRILTAFLQDEIGHGQLVLRVWEGLGKTFQDILTELDTGKLKMLNLFLYDFRSWDELMIFGMLADSLELDRLGALTHCSYAPYAHALVKVVREEAFHFRQACDAVRTMMQTGTDQQRTSLQDALNTWWPRIMAAYGPPDSGRGGNDQLVRWKLRIKSNEELRQQYLNRTVPLFQEWGLNIPDPNLRYDDITHQWTYTEPNWDEFFALINDREHPAYRRLRRWGDIAMERIQVTQQLMPEESLAYAA